MPDSTYLYLNADDKRMLAIVDALLQRGALTIKLRVGQVVIETQHIVPDVLPRPPSAETKEDGAKRDEAAQAEFDRDLYGAT